MLSAISVQCSAAFINLVLSAFLIQIALSIGSEEEGEWKRQKEIESERQTEREYKKEREA